MFIGHIYWSYLLVIFIIFVKAPAAPVLETLRPQVDPTLAVSNTDTVLFFIKRDFKGLFMSRASLCLVHNIQCTAAVFYTIWKLACQFAQSNLNELGICLT